MATLYRKLPTDKQQSSEQKTPKDIVGHFVSIENASSLSNFDKPKLRRITLIYN